jgi:amino acid permease
MLIPSNDPNLNDTSGTASQSPFVIAAGRAGIKVVPSIINAVVLTSAWSASNQAILAGTRILFGLAINKQAPAIFLRTTRWGIPYMCVLVQTAVTSLALVSQHVRNVWSINMPQQALITVNRSFVLKDLIRYLFLVLELVSKKSLLTSFLSPDTCHCRTGL